MKSDEMPMMRETPDLSAQVALFAILSNGLKQSNGGVDQLPLELKSLKKMPLNSCDPRPTPAADGCALHHQGEQAMEQMKTCGEFVAAARQERKNTMIIQPARLRVGAGNGKPEDGLCLMQMVDWFSGQERVSDAPACASPILTRIGIALNDTAPNQAARDSLWPLVWRLLDSRDPAEEQLRAEHIVREVAHRIVAPLFDSISPAHAANLRSARSIPEIKQAVAEAIESAEAWAWEESAESAAAWAAAAAAAAWAAAEVAWAAADSAASWAAAAAAAAAAESAAWAWAEVGTADVSWWTLRDIFIEAIALGKHGEADPVYAPRAEELRRRLESNRQAVA